MCETKNDFCAHDFHKRGILFSVYYMKSTTYRRERRGALCVDIGLLLNCTTPSLLFGECRTGDHTFRIAPEIVAADLPTATSPNKLEATSRHLKHFPLFVLLITYLYIEGVQNDF